MTKLLLPAEKNKLDKQEIQGNEMKTIPNWY